jgi:ADP-heptose:LPS heptosyltransferase
MGGWRELATWAITQGLSPVWFVGPDESELVEECRSLGGEVVTGDWSEVVDWHGRCTYGVTNDTVHLHIRAHSGVSTVGLFLVSSALHWGSYPGGSTCCLTLATDEVSVGADVVLSALENLMGPQ